jgi:hypothetical protein
MTAACFNILQVILSTNHIYQDTALQKAAVTLTARLYSTQSWWDMRNAAVWLFGGKDWGQSDKSPRIAFPVPAAAPGMAREVVSKAAVPKAAGNMKAGAKR